jgi:tripartite-type tricarboxylate transporter receptor subunit TctC
MKQSLLNVGRWLLLPLVVLAPLTESVAQSYPAKIIRVINPNQPGGNSDVMFRLLAPKMGEILGQSLVIDYRPGAGGNIGAEILAKSPPDGYTTMIASSSFLMNPALLKTLPFDTIKDFTPLGVITDLTTGLLVHPSLPVKTPRELIALAKKRNGDIFFSSSGQGAVGHLAGELLNSSAQINMVHVPYKGAGPSVLALVSGHVQLSFVSVPAVVTYVDAGRLRMIAQCGNKRFQSLPDLPTMQEAGVPGFVISSGYSFLGPAGLPQAVTDKLNAALAQTVRDPVIRKKLIDMGADPIANTPQEHAAYIRSEVEKWQRVAKSAGIKPE